MGLHFPPHFDFGNKKKKTEGKKFPRSPHLAQCPMSGKSLLFERLLFKSVVKGWNQTISQICVWLILPQATKVNRPDEQICCIFLFQLKFFSDHHKIPGYEI